MTTTISQSVSDFFVNGSSNFSAISKILPADGKFLSLTFLGSPSKDFIIFFLFSKLKSFDSNSLFNLLIIESMLSFLLMFISISLVNFSDKAFIIIL